MNSKVIFEFESNVNLFDSFVINNKTTGKSIFMQFLAVDTVPNVSKVGSTKEQSASYFYEALRRNYENNFINDLYPDQLTEPEYIFFIQDNVVIIEANDSCIEFVLKNNDSNINITIQNEDCSNEPVDENIVLTSFKLEKGTDCQTVIMFLGTNILLTTITQPINISNQNYIIEIEIPRNEHILFKGTSEKNNEFEYEFNSPSFLNANNFNVVIENKSNFALVSIEDNTIHSDEYPLIYKYSFDNINWVSINEFKVPLNMEYLIYIKDQYNCVITKRFKVSGFKNTKTHIKEISYCGTLHELNKGNYLNFFNKQKTMKIAFVCNEHFNYVKIFKSIQAILNIKYAIKNIKIITSLDQEKNISGEHFRYIIREGIHSVPLKNAYDTTDLRGNWALMELEIDSINNSKVDLFSVTLFLRKSNI